jgi:hypothetical protein
MTKVKQPTMAIRSACNRMTNPVQSDNHWYKNQLTMQPGMNPDMHK